MNNEWMVISFYFFGAEFWLDFEGMTEFWLDFEGMRWNG